MKPSVLLLTGSMNQTIQMHQISQYLPDCTCYFSQIYADSALVNWAVRRGLADTTILAGQFRQNAEAYLHQHNLPIDYKGQARHYDLVILCTDLFVPANVRVTRSVWVQEGMVDPVTLLTKLVKALRLPRYLAMGTSLNGSSNLADVYCVGSAGYRNFFAGMGTDPAKIFVTGIPNFDNLEQYRENDFPHRDYVLVATTDMRETWRPENRPAFIEQCVAIAAGRQLIFKLHPNEMQDRAEAEIREFAPANTLIYRTGNTNAMIANCAELITQYSTVVYVGMALNKPVHSYFDIDELRQQVPIQNGGQSARFIAQICRDFLDFEGPRHEFANSFRQSRTVACVNQ